MQLNASEISDLIKKEIEGFDFSAEARTEGTVISCLLYTSPSPRDRG